MLGANRFVDDENLARDEVFAKIADAAGAKVTPLNITVNKEDRVTRYGVQRRCCPMHGGDGTGDNSFSKNTLMTNYLPMAHHFGVQLHPRVEVDRVEKQPDGRWQVTGVRRSGSRGTKTEPVTITARTVVLSAGAMGTNGILLRSRDRGLPISPRVGKNFSGNGDNFAIAYNTDHRTDTQSWSTDGGPPRSGLMCGPSITARRPGPAALRSGARTRRSAGRDRAGHTQDLAGQPGISAPSCHLPRESRCHSVPRPRVRHPDGG